MTNLRRLNLHNNQIVQIKSGTFDDLQSLQFLGLGNNIIDSFFFETDRNLITSIANDVFKNLKKLQKVFLKNNFCINKDFEDFAVVSRVTEAVTNNCQLCDVHNPNYMDCVMKKLIEKQMIQDQEFSNLSQNQNEKLQETQSRIFLIDAQSKLNKDEIRSTKQELLSNITKVGTKYDDEEDDLRRKVGDNIEVIEKLRTELNDLKNSTEGYFSWKTIVAIFTIFIIIVIVLFF